MRIHRHRHRKPKYSIPNFKVNEKIQAEEVRFVHEAFNGVLPLKEAIAKAKELGIDETMTGKQALQKLM